MSGDFLSQIESKFDEDVKTNSSNNKQESFDDMLKAMSNILIDPKFKKNFISNISSKNAKGIIQLAARIQFYRNRFGLMDIHTYKINLETGKYERDEDGNPIILETKKRYYDTSVAETVLTQALVTKPAINGKQADKIVDMMKNNIAGAIDEHKQMSLFNKLGFSGLRR